jgi:hypothetical protein
MVCHLQSRRASKLIRVEDNPDHFHLWATNLQFGYAFTYDPLAADHWLFDSAAVARNQPTGLMPIRSREVESNEQRFELLNRAVSQ